MNHVHTKLLVSVGALALLAHSPTYAALKETNPSIACKLLNASGLITGAWKDYGPGGGSAGNFGCTSPYKELGSGYPLANNLAYYVDGGKSAATQAKLVLNVNNKSQAPSAHSALLSSSELLSISITGAKLPASVKEAISAGKPIKAKVGQSAVEVLRDNWPTGKGYELHVIFK